MSDAMYVAATGMRAHQAEIDVISNNVANINTTAFRRERVSYTELTATGALSPNASGDSVQLPRVRGVGTAADVQRSVESGALKETGDPLHVAIDGPGFIELLREDGTLVYTRAGLLRVLADGQLATTGGVPLAAQITLPQDMSALQIGGDGRVKARSGTDPEWIEIGQIDAVNFVNPAGMRPAGDGLFVATSESGEPQLGKFGEAGIGVLRQGLLEQSNVELGDEMIALMVAQRAFEMNSRVFQVADQMLAMTNALPKT